MILYQRPVELPVLPSSEACERNKAPILNRLRVAFADRAQVLEIGSGTGQHAVFFAAALPHLTWHPTEQLRYLSDLGARVRREGSANLQPPTELDVRQAVWPVRSVDAIFTANTLHIMAWSDVIELFRGVDSTLVADGCLCIYGPFLDAGRPTSDSNRDFDRMLQARDPRSGIREMGALLRLADESGLELVADHEMPANNRLLHFERRRAAV